MKQRIFLLVLGSCVGIGVFLYSVFSWYSGILSVAQTPSEETIKTMEEKEVLPSLSLEDKFGQMLIIGFEGTEVTPEVSSLFSSIRPGGVLLLGRNIVSKGQVKKLIADLQEISMRATGLPLFVAVDQEGGIVSRVPWAENTGSSALEDSEEAFLVGERRARDLKEVGVNMNLAPVLDSSGEDDFLFNRSFQKDQDSSFAIAQGLILGHAQEGVIAVPKHFPGYDGVSFNPETGVLPTTKNFPSAPLFKEVLEGSRVPFIMLSHVVYQAVDPDNPLPLSVKGMERARKELGDQFLFMSDDLTSKSFMAHYSLREIGRAALNSGVNILLVGGYPNTAVVGEFYQVIRSELAQEQLSLFKAASMGGLYEMLSGMVEGDGKLQERIEESAARIIKFKQDMIR
ncbi:MAG: glycoside hydrolase family 3 N-terminal domain-containing protein [bacterium]|nr:glycoside hydrolase family 3 N-terminal domain-containing protein [bacterium]